MLEILFLLLPLAFYSGWRTARRNQNLQSRKSSQQDHSTRFVRGINYLLNEEPDKALDTFLEFPALDAQTADTFLALGKLFRNRGEVNRALCIHQHLVARPDLSSSQRQAAMLALGEDFFAAGMLDRAESVFRELMQNYPKNTQACAPLRHIYEQLQEWDKAIALSDCNVANRSGRNQLLVHYLCEQAEQYLHKNALYQMSEKLKKAATIQPESSRVHVLKAELALAHSDRQLALKHFRQAVENDRRLLGMLGRRLLEVFDQPAELRQMLQFVVAEYAASKDVHLFPALLSLAHETGQQQAVLPQVAHHLQHAPLTVQAISRTADFFLDMLPEKDPGQSLQELSQALSRLLQTLARFQCTHCGYKMSEYRWRCPACHQWDTIQHT